MEGTRKYESGNASGQELIDGNSAKCCRCFSLPFTPDLKGIGLFSKPIEKYQDGNIIKDMVIFVGDIVNEGQRHNLFTCKHLDREKGECRIYEKRPITCKTYPNGLRKCGYLGCKTYDKCNAILKLKNHVKEVNDYIKKEEFDKELKKERVV